MKKSQTYIEIRNGIFLLLEGMDKITVYSTERIAVRCGGTDITVTGDELTLDFLSDDRISVKGKIRGVYYEKVQSV